MISGKFLTVKIGGVVLFNNYEWRADEGGDILDATTGADLGAEFEEMGVESCHITTNLYLDILDGVYLLVQRGTILSNLALYYNETDTIPALFSTNALVTRSNRGAAVRDKFVVNVDIHTRGPYVSNDPQ